MLLLSSERKEEELGIAIVLQVDAVRIERSEPRATFLKQHFSLQLNPAHTRILYSPELDWRIYTLIGFSVQEILYLLQTNICLLTSIAAAQSYSQKTPSYSLVG